MLGLRAGPAEGVSKVGLQSYRVHASVANAFRRRLLPCKPAVVPGMCPHVVGKAETYPQTRFPIFSEALLMGSWCLLVFGILQCIQGTVA